MTPDTKQTDKKAYSEPQLRVYGDIRQITQHTSNIPTHNADSPPHSGSLMKT
jgi:hypothetical protein